MNPQEKALDLIKKLLPSMYCYMGSGMLSNTYDEFVALDNAKRCATLLADEVHDQLWEAGVRGDMIEYWVSVKDQIQKVSEFPEESDEDEN